MTYENCIKYRDEAEDEETKKFWADRIKRKYPQLEVKEEVKEEPVKKTKSKKKEVEDDNN